MIQGLWGHYAHVPLFIVLWLLQLQPSEVVDAATTTTTTNLQKLLHTHLNALDACKVATIYLRRFSILIAHKVANVIVLPVAKAHSTSLAITGVVIGGNDCFITRMKFVCGVMCGSTARRWRLHDGCFLRLLLLFNLCNLLLRACYTAPDNKATRWIPNTRSCWSKHYWL